MDPTQNLPVPQGCTCGNNSTVCQRHKTFGWLLPAPYTPPVHPILPHDAPCYGAEHLSVPFWGYGWSSEYLPPLKCLGSSDAPREGHERRGEEVDE